MACRGVYFALSKEEAAKLLNVTGDDEVLHIVKEEIEERWNEEWLQEVDKAWDAIHRCLGDGSLLCKGKSLLEKCVLGGRQLYIGSDYIISYLDTNEVKDTANSLETVAKNWFRAKYFGLKKKFLFFDLTDYAGPINEDDFEYTWYYFEQMRFLFRKAANANRSIIFTVDQ
ncbi:MAG: DUF1877 family protein [Planctomycetota bacterium]